MARVNKNYRKLASGYLFPEIARRTRAWQEKNPGVKVMRLGIGNTTEALPPYLVSAMKAKLDLLADRNTYTGYGDEQGDTPLREALAQFYKKHYNVDLESTEFFVSDGAKPDSANLQDLFTKDAIIAVQDPAYPVYVDSNVVAGRTGEYDENIPGYKGLVYLKSDASNGFVPEPPKEKVDVIYLCSPNNPTGAVATKAQLKKFVDYAIANKAIIIFDAAYSSYIKDPSLPRTIYEVEGAKSCAIEMNSFSKNAGFTGVRLGWSVVPKALMCEDSEAGELHKMWNRHSTTFFNGASNIAQAGGIAALSDEGFEACQELVEYYKGNAAIIKEGLESVGLSCIGGIDSPYIWAKTPNNMKSWDFFDLLLDKCHVVVTPGSGFGAAGEGYVRVSSYGHREDVIEAINSIKAYLK
ncbi:MAG: LL-diaminopimelate aminotransferase [Sphaerochaetaceae bacterium]|nr:LL-diaminopimelate aminotransferase [Sphaerochaetaceae bacterium]